MKIIEPSAEIIEDELSSLSVYQRIDRCTSVCYQRPPKPTEEEAREFCKKLVKLKHFAALEMAVVHLWIRFRDLPDSNYIQIEPTGETDLDPFICSGSIRAFMEAACGDEVHRFLAQQHPVLLQADGVPPDKYSVRFAKPEEIPWQHKHVAVRFIINRAVSHELVRHRPCSFLQESQRFCRYTDEVAFVRPLWTYDCLQRERAQWEIHMENCEAYYREKLRQEYKPQQARGGLPNDTKTELIVYASLPEWKHIFSLRCSAAADPEMRRVMVPLRDEFRKKHAEAFEY